MSKIISNFFNKINASKDKIKIALGHLPRIMQLIWLIRAEISKNQEIKKMCTTH